MIDAPHVLQAARTLAVPAGWMAVTYNLGEAIANLLQPGPRRGHALASEGTQAGVPSRVRSLGSDACVLTYCRVWAIGCKKEGLG